jgi:hypothetical protein
VPLGLDQAQRARVLARRPALDAALGALDRRHQIVGVQGVLGRPQVPGHRAGRLVAEPEVLGQHHRVAGPLLLQPLAGQPVAERAILLGQHRVRGLAHQRVREGQLDVAAAL